MYTINRFKKMYSHFKAGLSGSCQWMKFVANILEREREINCKSCSVLGNGNWEESLEKFITILVSYWM